MSRPFRHSGLRRLAQTKSIRLLSLVLMVVACADSTRGASAPALPPPAPSCTSDAQGSIFRPADFASLASRSTLVVLGRVVSHSVEAENVGEFLVTWVDSTIAVERVLFASDAERRPAAVLVRTMAEGRTCDLYDAIPLRGPRYVFFLDAVDTSHDGDPRYHTVGGSWAGRLVVSGQTLRAETPAGRAPSQAATAVEALTLSSLTRAIAAARPPTR